MSPTNVPMYTNEGPWDLHVEIVVDSVEGNMFE